MKFIILKEGFWKSIFTDIFSTICIILMMRESKGSAPWSIFCIFCLFIFASRTTNSLRFNSKEELLEWAKRDE